MKETLLEIVQNRCQSSIQNILVSILRKGIKNYDFLEKKIRIFFIALKRNLKVKKFDL